MFTRLSLINGTLCKRQTESGRTLTIRINHNRSIAIEQSVINYWGRGFNRFILQQPHPRFCCDSYTHRSWSVRLKDIYSSVNQQGELINQDSSLRWNKMCTQQQPTRKRWRNRSPKVEPRWTRPKTDHQAPANLTEIFKPELSLSLSPNTPACN